MILLNSSGHACQIHLWCQTVPGTVYLVQCTRYSVPGTVYLVERSSGHLLQPGSQGCQAFLPRSHDSSTHSLDVAFTCSSKNKTTLYRLHWSLYRQTLDVVFTLSSKDRTGKSSSQFPLLTDLLSCLYWSLYRQNFSSVITGPSTDSHYIMYLLT